jgi:hypothetical protein
LSYWIVNVFFTDLFIDVKGMKYLLVIFLVGYTQPKPVPRNINEANCIVRVGDKLFLTICKENKT